MHLLLVISALAWLIVQASAHACTAPSFVSPTTILAPGQHLFEQVVGVHCESKTDVISGRVFLYRPNDPTFIPLIVGHWNGRDESLSTNTIRIPPLHRYGYGFRVKIVPDRDSPSRTPQESDTFTIVSRTWFDDSVGQIRVLDPGYYGDEWNEYAEYFLTWEVLNRNRISSSSPFAIYLYKANDLTWGPMLLASRVNGNERLRGPYSPIGTYEHYIRFPEGLLLGFGYQVVLTKTANDKSEVLAVTSPLSILSYPMTTASERVGGPAGHGVLPNKGAMLTKNS